MKENLKSILNQLQININITDVKTHEILFMNENMKKEYGVENPGGKACWEVLQTGVEGPCKSCKIPKLLEEVEMGKFLRWREHSEKTDKVFEHYDSLTEWDGKLAYMQHSYDMTHTLKLQEKADKDDLCGVWKRATGKGLLKERFSQMKKHGYTYLIVILNIDGLRSVNETYGYVEGDFLIKQTIEVLKQFVKDPNFIVRLSGDEFMIVLQDVKEQEGIREILRWRKAVEEQQTIFDKPYKLTFSFGTNYIKSARETRLNEIIAKADDKMYDEKMRRVRNKIIEADDFSAEEVQGRKIEYPSELLFEALSTSSENFIFVCDMKTGTYQYSTKLVKAFDLPGVILKSPIPYWKNIVHPEDWERFYKANVDIKENRVDYHLVEFRAKKRSGEYVWMKCKGQLIRDEYDRPILLTGVMTEMGMQNKVDSLTQLMNHQEFFKRIGKNIEEDSIEKMAVITLDMDEFSRINELYTRSFGDYVLRNLAQMIQSVLPGNAFLFRMEKDQMGILMENASNHDVEKLYRSIQGTLLRNHEWDDKKLSVEASAGCAMYPVDGTTVEELYSYSGYALKHAKNIGKNRLEFFSKDILNNKLRSLELMRDLRHTIDRQYEGFYLSYQPQVDAKTQKMKGVEALIRWQDPEGNLVSPMEFIPIIEKHGMIYEVGLWTLRTAMCESLKWVTMDPGFSLSVNISMLQLIEENFLEDLYTVMKEEAFPAENLIIEMTESCTVKNMRSIQDKLVELRTKGIRIALDDFGTGYSSLGILKHAPVDIVKIDKVFVKDILSSSFDATFISFVVAICHDVKIKVCLEGIETEKEYDFLTDMQLDYIQGYYFGKPMLAQEITTRLYEET